MGVEVTIINDLNSKCQLPKPGVTSTPTRPVENVVITTKGLQDRNNLLLDGMTVENKGKLILNQHEFCFNTHPTLIGVVPRLLSHHQLYLLAKYHIVLNLNYYTSKSYRFHFKLVYSHWSNLVSSPLSLMILHSYNYRTLQILLVPLQ